MLQTIIHNIIFISFQLHKFHFLVLPILTKIPTTIFINIQTRLTTAWQNEITIFLCEIKHSYHYSALNFAIKLTILHSFAVVREINNTDSALRVIWIYKISKKVEQRKTIKIYNSQHFNALLNYRITSRSLKKFR